MVFLQKTVLSVLSQNVSNWELKLVDGSGTYSREVGEFVESLKDKRIEYCVNTGDTSMAGNWNFCIKLASYNLVTLLHDDDYLLPTYLESIISLNEQQPTALAYFTGARTVDGNGKPCLTMADRVKRCLQPKSAMIQLSGDHGLSTLLAVNFIFCPTLCYQKKYMHGFSFQSKWHMVADLQFYSSALVDGKSFYGVSEPHYIYRRHESNQTAKLTVTTRRFDEEIQLYNQLAASLDSKLWPKSQREAAGKSMIKKHIIFTIILACLRFDFRYATRLFKLFRSC